MWCYKGIKEMGTYWEKKSFSYNIQALPENKSLSKNRGITKYHSYACRGLKAILFGVLRNICGFSLSEEHFYKSENVPWISDSNSYVLLYKYFE